MIKIWGGVGKRAAKNKTDVKSRLADTRKAWQNVKYRIPKEDKVAIKNEESQLPSKTTQKPQKIIDFETLQQMYNEHNGVEYDGLVAAGDELSVNSYAKKQKNLKFLTL